MNRCSWVTDEQLYIDYHDHEWGVEVRDDKKLFEMLCLEGAQAGLSWITILRRRDNYRRVFFDFDLQKNAQLSDEQLLAILQDSSIIRNRLKVFGVRKNALAFMQVQRESGSFNSYLWSFTNYVPLLFEMHSQAEATANQLSKDLRKRGFTFVGPTICFAFMQAIGMINDHEPSCYRYQASNRQ